MGGQHNATKAFNYLTGCIAFRIIRSTAQTETVVSRTSMHIIGQIADALWIAMAKNPQRSWKSARKDESVTLNKHFGQSVDFL